MMSARTNPASPRSGGPLLPRLALALLAFAAALMTSPRTAHADFPLAKINFIDTSEAPKIRVWASALKRNWRPPGDKDITGISVYRKPTQGSAELLFGVESSGDVAWPKTMSEADVKQRAATPPELALAAETDQGSAIVVVVPGFQDPEYRDGTLGERSRSGAGLFFKKLGQANLMNVLWYTDFVYAFVFAEGRTNSLSRLETERAQCAAWERERLGDWGMTPEELAARDGADAGAGPKKGEARCGLTKDYGDLGRLVGKMAYDGFWPQLFGLQQHLCVTPEHQRKATGFVGSDADATGSRLTALDAALEMLVKGGTAAMPKILVLTGDGRDGYIEARSNCRQKYTFDCQERPEIAGLKGTAKSDALQACVQEGLERDIRVEQGSFIEKLDTWVGLAKAAGVRIYTVTHPTAPPYARERMDVLAWRTGGTARFAEDANQVGDLYDDLITELNNQVVITFVDEEAKPGAELQYEVEIRGLLGSGATAATARSDAFKVTVPPGIERSFIHEIRDLGQAKLGKTGFLAVVIGVGLLLLVIVLKLVMKLVKGGSAKATKAAKGGGDKAAAKAKAKAIEKAKKAKEAQKKAMAKAKKG